MPQQKGAVQKRVVTLPDSKTGKSIRYLSAQAAAVIEAQRGGDRRRSRFLGMKGGEVEGGWALKLVRRPTT